jgi:hypothetical protein
MNLIQEKIKDTVVCGIKGIKSIKLSKKALNFNSQNGKKEFIVFEAIGSDLKSCLAHS